MISLFERAERQVPSNSNELCFENFYCKADFIHRFSDDKIKFQTDDYLLVLDGIVLNKKGIMSESSKGCWLDCILDMYKAKGEQFFSSLRGSFVGILLDKNTKHCIIFRDQLGSRPVYYSSYGKLGGMSNSIAELYEEIKKYSSLELCSEGVQMLLDFGITFDGYTIAKGVKMLHPGCYLVYENGEFVEKVFYTFKRDETKLSSEMDYVDMIDDAYREAVKRQFSKDDEYGYKTIACLSGGIDSRMTVWISHELGWKHQLNITFSNSGWYDETTARKISLDLRHEWLFKRLEDANFMTDVDSATRVTGGNRSYIGVVHSRSMTSLIDYDGGGYGILHTGSQGEVLKGEAVAGGVINKNDNRYLNYLKKLGINPMIDYSDPEIATTINKYLFIAQNDSMSPLLELDFFEQTLKIPASLRKDEYIYRKWVTTKYKEMNKYVWATTGAPYGSKSFNPYIKICGCYMRQLPKYINYKLGNGGFAMNPWNYFVEMNKEIIPLYNTYSDYLDAITDVALRGRVADILKSNNLMNKIKAVSLLSAIKIFFS